MTRSKKSAGRTKNLLEGDSAETRAEVRADAAALARSIAQVAAAGTSEARDRGPAPPMPVPIATFNI